jgi:type II secretory pathway pseudopilin PulG
MRFHRKRAGEQAGYMLLVLMLAVALLMITMLGVANNYKRSVLRDKEVEMIHRGVQYERAVRLFYRKNGTRYPASIEQLENTNKIRYLRKRYKDPMTKDGTWKWAHQNDLPSVPGAGTGLTPSTGMAGAGGAQGSPAQATTDATKSSDADEVTAGPEAGGQPAGAQSASTSQPGNATTGGATSGGDNNPATSGQVLGGQILGVISKSKLVGIHTFNDKSHYNEWLFIYDPTQDRGQLPNGPYNPNAARLTNGLTPSDQSGTSQPGLGLPAGSPQPGQSLPAQPTSPQQ